MREPITVRRETPDDVPVIMHHRRAMFEDMGMGSKAQLDDMDAQFERWLREKLDAGDYLGWFAVNSAGQVVAGIGLWVMEWPPAPLDPSSRRPYLLNVYTEPAYRRRGLARRLVVEALDWSRAHGFRSIALHASDAGRSVYESLNFSMTNEMRLELVR